MKISPGSFGVSHLSSPLAQIERGRETDESAGIPLRVWYIVLACVGIFSFSRLLIRKLLPICLRV